MAVATGQTSTNETNVVITTTDGSTISSRGGYVAGSILGGADYTLPDATVNGGVIIIIDNDTGSAFDITGYSSQTINGETTITLEDNCCITLRSNYSEWRIISNGAII